MGGHILKNVNGRGNGILLSQYETQVMRGLAILFIICHNLLHWILPVVENEFSYDQSKYVFFIEQFRKQPEWLLSDSISFLGWLGVPVFLFLSGYGLVRKYEMTDTSISIMPFLKYHWFKTVKLMFFPMLCYAILISVAQHELFNPLKFILQLSLLGNIFFCTRIDPGVFWFFGLIFQLYVIYRLIIYKRNLKVLLALNCLCLFALALLVAFKRDYLFEWAMHNFVGWIMSFSVGIVFARYGFKSSFNKYWKLILVFITCCVLIFISNANVYLWIFSPILAILATIALVKFVLSFSGLRCLFYIGGVSSIIFAVHPIIRRLFIWSGIKELFMPATPYSFGQVLYVLCYVILTIIIAVIYKKLIEYFKVQGCRG